MRAEEDIEVEVVREGNRQVGVIGLLQSESVEPHEGIHVLLPDKLGHGRPLHVVDRRLKDPRVPRSALWCDGA